MNLNTHTRSQELDRVLIIRRKKRGVTNCINQKLFSATLGLTIIKQRDNESSYYVSQDPFKYCTCSLVHGSL